MIQTKSNTDKMKFARKILLGLFLVLALPALGQQPDCESYQAYDIDDSIGQWPTRIAINNDGLMLAVIRTKDLGDHQTNSYVLNTSNPVSFYQGPKTVSGDLYGGYDIGDNGEVVGAYQGTVIDCGGSGTEWYLPFSYDSGTGVWTDMAIEVCQDCQTHSGGTCPVVEPLPHDAGIPYKISGANNFTISKALDLPPGGSGIAISGTSIRQGGVNNRFINFRTTTRATFAMNDNGEVVAYMKYGINYQLRRLRPGMGDTTGCNNEPNGMIDQDDFQLWGDGLPTNLQGLSVDNDGDIIALDRQAGVLMVYPGLGGTQVHTLDFGGNPAGNTIIAVNENKQVLLVSNPLYVLNFGMNKAQDHYYLYNFETGEMRYLNQELARGNDIFAVYDVNDSAQLAVVYWNTSSSDYNYGVTCGDPQVEVPCADFTFNPVEPAVGSRITFLAQPAILAYPYTWDLDMKVDSDGDGEPENDIDARGASIRHTYDTPGMKLVKLTVNGSCVVIKKFWVHSVGK